MDVCKITTHIYHHEDKCLVLPPDMIQHRCIDINRDLAHMS